MLIGEDLARRIKAPRRRLDRPRECVAFNGEVTRVTTYVRVRMTLKSAHEEEVSALIVPGLSKEVILGIPWLEQQHPIIDWKHRTVGFDPVSCSVCLKPNKSKKCRVDGANSWRESMKTAEELAAERKAQFERGIRTVGVAEFEEELKDPANEVYRIEMRDEVECNATKIEDLHASFEPRLGATLFFSPAPDVVRVSALPLVKGFDTRSAAMYRPSPDGFPVARLARN